MNVIPQKPFTWIIVGVAIYAYATHYNEKKQIEKNNAGNVDVTEEIAADKNKENESGILDEFSKESISVKSATDKDGATSGAVNYIVKELSKTDTGKAFIRALADKSIKKKYGNNDVSIITATNEKRIVIVDKLLGKGAEATCGSRVKVRYDIISSKYDMKIDSNKDSKKPMSITIGEGSVIRGLENGIVGMKVGGIRKVAIPAHLAYGDPRFNNNAILNNTTILAEVELVEVENGKKYDQDVVISEVFAGKGFGSVLCGSDVTVSYSTPSGNKGSFNFVTGDNKVPYGIEKGIWGMKKEHERRLEVPYELMKFDNMEALNDLGVVEGEMFTINVKVTSLNVNGKQAIKPKRNH